MGEDIVVAIYNVEALFDCTKDGETIDDDYLPHGHYAWTEDKLARKIANLARVLGSINGGRGPDVLALAEVENRGVVEQLDAALRHMEHITLAHHEGEDLHGLENALLSRFPLAAGRAPQMHHLSPVSCDRKWRMRGILEVHLDLYGATLIVFVNHWPAGAGRAAAQRVDAAQQLRALVDQRTKEEPRAKIVVLGDFNANPTDAAFGPRALRVTTDREATKDGALYHTMAEGRSAPTLAALEAVLKEQGSCTHFTRPPPYDGPDGEWNILDHIFVSHGLLDAEGELTWVRGSTEIVREEFMLADDGTPRGFFERGVKPRDQDLERTGFSDHLPVITRLRWRRA